ncbi:MAG: hypothetical protein WA738_09945 [Candidatus Angelobacter sp.]
MNDEELKDIESLESIPTITKLVAIVLATSGLLLISISLLITEGGRWYGLLRDLTKELGIVILAVFGVSLLYELVLAKRYIKTFLRLLASEVVKGESNAAVCAFLGIRRIFPTRDAFEKEYSLLKLAPQLRRGGDLRVVARSLVALLNNPGAITDALAHGTNVELCLLTPYISPERASLLSDLEVGDIRVAISVFSKKLAGWIKSVPEKPTGRLELRVHDVDLFDSWLVLRSPMQTFAGWDLSFGRDVLEKRVFVLEPNGRLGSNLSQRYDLIYKGADAVFKYDGKEIVIDKLSQFEPPPTA